MTFTLDSADVDDVETIEFTVTFSVSGSLCEVSVAVACTAGTGWAEDSRVIDTDDSEVTLNMSKASAATAGTTLTICTFSSTSTPTSGNFTIVVDDAEDDSGDDLDPLPELDVGAISEIADSGDCDTTPSTTSPPPSSTSTTSTTL